MRFVILGSKIVENLSLSLIVMSSKVENLNPDDVVCFTEDDGFGSPIYNIEQRFGISKLFEFGECVNGISKLINLSTEATELLTEGIKCRVMTTRQQGWRFGKIRLKIELQFIPDEPLEDQNVAFLDNPLDEIRKTSDATIPKATN